MLLMLRDDKGTLESQAHMYPLALGGSLLAELLLAGAITIDDDKKKRVRVAPMSVTERLDDPLLQECLEIVAKSKRPYRAPVWVGRFGRIKRLRHRIAESLCRKDILEDSEDKVLFFFTRAIYPTINPEPERLIVESMRDAVLGSSQDLNADVVLLIALAQATGLMRIHFEKTELKARKIRIKEIAEGNLAGDAAAGAVLAAQQAAQAAQAAVMAAIIASTVASATTHC
jgi:Golgi phosphoprotein 3